MLENLTFQNLFHEPLKGAIKAKVLASKTILKIRYRSSSKYLVIEDVAGDEVESLELMAESRTKSFFSSSISLFIKEKAQDIRPTEGTMESATEAQFLQEYPWP